MGFNEDLSDNELAVLVTGKTASRKKACSRKHREETVKVGRKDRCPCGSDMQYRKCCM